MVDKQKSGHENNSTLLEIINVYTSKIQLVHYILVNEKDRNSIHASFYKHTHIYSSTKCGLGLISL